MRPEAPPAAMLNESADPRSGSSWTVGIHGECAAGNQPRCRTFNPIHRVGNFEWTSGIRPTSRVVDSERCRRRDSNPRHADYDRRQLLRISLVLADSCLVRSVQLGLFLPSWGHISGHIFKSEIGATLV